MKLFKTFILTIAVLVSASLSAQTMKVKCTVKDNLGPLPGASVAVKGTTIGTVANLDGVAELDNVKPDDIIVVSFIGYGTVETPVAGKSQLEIVLVDDSIALQETVVVGYGTQKKANLTGSVDQVTSEVFEGRSNANVAQMLQGQVPGLNLTFTDGRPNSSPSFNIRGKTSVGAGGSALVLIDGVEGDSSLLNPDDIESVSILKDAASAAVYGARAPYGVVIITTKTAKKGRAKVSYSANISFQTPTSIPDVVTDGYTYASMFYDAWYNYKLSNPSNINKTQQFSLAWLQEYKRHKDAGYYETVVSDGTIGSAGRWVYYHKGTNYYDALYKDFTLTQTHNISVSGGDDKFEYYFSGRLYDNNGLFDTTINPEKYRMYNGRMKMSYQIVPWLKLSNNTSISYTNYVFPVTYGEGNGNVWRTIADEGHPSSPLFNPDGTMTYSAVYSIGDQLYGKSRRIYENNQTQTTFTALANFFDNRLRINADFTYNSRHNATNTRMVRTPYSKTLGVIETIDGTQSYMSETFYDYTYITTNEFVEYEQTFAGKHYFKALVGFNYEQESYKRTYARANDLIDSSVENIQLAEGVTIEDGSIVSGEKTTEGNWTKWRNAGVFFRLNYAYADRYLVEINGRYDGSSKFPDNSQWAFFPSVSAGWRLSEEPWFNVSKQAVSNIKIRASIGGLGNNNVKAYLYKELFTLDKSPLVINGSSPTVTSIPSTIPDSLTWETAVTGDVGLDLGFLGGRLNLTADGYIRKTLDMFCVGPTLPEVFGASSPKGNYGEMTTRGYELNISWADRFDAGGKPFHYSIKASLSDYVSKIDKFNNATGNLGDYYAGQTIGEIWGFISNGLYQTQEEVDRDQALAEAAGQTHFNNLMQLSESYVNYPGDIKFEDLNGNGYLDKGSNTVSDPGDRRIIGNSEPRYVYGFGFDLEWNGIFLNAYFQGIGKRDWYPSNESSMFWGQYNRPYNQVPTWHLGNYWTEDNPDAYLPRYTGYYGAFYKGTNNANSRYLQSAAYCRLKNLQVGYSFPKELIGRIKLQKLSIFFSGENLFTWSPLYKYSRDIDVTANILDSDTTLASGKGDGYNYPTMRSFSIGLNITF
ncbi:MAG: TonB-dependent receptor [Bacteroidales bacterium]|nr:TonB-dependent receptor [Bacteroidales bacterium]